MSVLDLVLWAPVAGPFLLLVAKVLLIWFVASLAVCGILLGIAIISGLASRWRERSP